MATLLWLVYLFCVPVLLAWDEIIAPVTQNGTTEHYVSSLTTSPEIRYNVIQCQSPICIVTCDTYQGCHQSTINASLSNSLILNCIHPSSCRFGDVIGSMDLTEINCLSEDSCSYETFDLDNTINVTINCLNESACSKSDINMNNAVNINIKCENPICRQQPCNGSPYGSCTEMNFNAMYASNVNIQCIHSFACWKSTFNVNYSDITTIGTNLDSANVIGIGITTKLDIHCYDCWGANIYCPTNAFCNLICNGTVLLTGNACRVAKIYTVSNSLINNNDFNLQCIGSGTACELMDFQCGMNVNDQFSRSIIDEYDGLYKCTDYSCCPFIYNKTVIYCPMNQTNCIINCHSSNQCKFAFVDIMDGSMTTSLTINCDTVSSVCQALTVIINKQIDVFKMNCLSYQSCEYLLLDVKVINSVFITCNSPLYSYSCSQSVIVINGTSITDINIDTTGLSYSQLTITNANYLNVSCGDRGCDFLNVIAPDINSIYIICNGSYSCYVSSWDVNATNDIRISCVDNYACQQTVWDIIADNVIINCPSAVENSECSRVNVNGDISNSLVITTGYNNTISGPFGTGTSSAFASNVNVSCADCINIYECSQNITFYCGDGSSVISDGKCLNCQCTERGYGSLVNTNDVFNQCFPTPEPTLYPSVNPTTEPTMNPTVNPTKETLNPTNDPSVYPTNNPTVNPTNQPTTFDPTENPTNNPTKQPTTIPTNNPTFDPTAVPTDDPTAVPTDDPTTFPTHYPTEFPTIPAPTDIPTNSPTVNPVTVIISNPTTSKSSITTTDRIHAAENASSSNELTSIIIWVIIGFVVVFVMMIGIYCCVRNKSNVNNKNNRHKNVKKKHEQIYEKQQVQEMVVLSPQPKQANSQQLIMVQMPDGRMVSAKLMDPAMIQPQQIQNVNQQIPAYNPNAGNIAYDEGEGGKGDHEKEGVTKGVDIFV